MSSDIAVLGSSNIPRTVEVKSTFVDSFQNLLLEVKTMTRPDKLLIEAEKLSLYIYTRLMQSMPGSKESMRFRKLARLSSKREKRRLQACGFSVRSNYHTLHQAYGTELH